MKWYISKAAEQGYAAAQLNLGAMYYNNRGVPENDVQAYMWWSIAKAQGDVLAADWLDDVKERMIPTMITKAQALAAEWWEKHNN